MSTTSTRCSPSPKRATAPRVAAWGPRWRPISTSRCSTSGRPRTGRNGRPSSRRPRRASWIARNPLGLHDPALRRRRRRAARQALAQCDVTDHGDVRHHRPGVPRAAAHVDPVGGGRRAHPPATARRQGVLAARRRPAAPVHARGHQRARRRGGAAWARRRGDRHLRALPDPDHLRAARRAEGGLEAVQPMGDRRAAHLQRQPGRRPADDRRRPGRARRLHARAHRRPPRQAGRGPAHRPHRRRGGGRQAVRPRSW